MAGNDIGPGPGFLGVYSRAAQYFVQAQREIAGFEGEDGEFKVGEKERWRVRSRHWLIGSLMNELWKVIDGTVDPADLLKRLDDEASEAKYKNAVANWQEIWIEGLRPLYLAAMEGNPDG